MNDPSIIELNEVELMHHEFLMAVLCQLDPTKRATALGAFRKAVQSWAAESAVTELGDALRFAPAYARPESKALWEFTDAGSKLAVAWDSFSKHHERRFNIAVEIGFQLYFTIKNETFRGVHTVPGGILSKISDVARAEGIRGGRDKEVLSAIWRNYRGFIHLPVAMGLLEEARREDINVLSFASEIQELFSDSCARNSKTPYIPASQQISFVEITML